MQKQMEELQDGVVLEFRFPLRVVEKDLFYMVYVNQKLSMEDINAIEAGIASYMDQVSDKDPKQLIHDVLGSLGYSHRIADYRMFVVKTHD